MVESPGTLKDLDLEYSLNQEDYKRYGLDDPRSGAHRPMGNVKVSYRVEKWMVSDGTGTYALTNDVWIYRLFDCFQLESVEPHLAVLIPFSNLTEAQVSLLTSRAEQRHPENSTGDFYVTKGGCLRCGAPEDAAPDLIAYGKDGDCHFRRQPETSEEVEEAIRAVLACCVGCYRYAGKNPVIIKRLRSGSRDLSLSFPQNDVCDHPDA